MDIKCLILPLRTDWLESLIEVGWNWNCLWANDTWLEGDFMNGHYGNFCKKPVGKAFLFVPTSLTASNGCGSSTEFAKRRTGISTGSDLEKWFYVCTRVQQYQMAVVAVEFITQFARRGNCTGFYAPMACRKQIGRCCRSLGVSFVWFCSKKPWLGANSIVLLCFS